MYLLCLACSDRPIFINIYVSVFPGLCSLAGLGLDPAAGTGICTSNSASY